MNIDSIIRTFDGILWITVILKIDSIICTFNGILWITVIRIRDSGHWDAWHLNITGSGIALDWNLFEKIINNPRHHLYLLLYAPRHESKYTVRKRNHQYTSPTRTTSYTLTNTHHQHGLTPPHSQIHIANQDYLLTLTNTHHQPGLPPHTHQYTSPIRTTSSHSPIRITNQDNLLHLPIHITNQD